MIKNDEAAMEITIEDSQDNDEQSCCIGTRKILQSSTIAFKITQCQNKIYSYTKFFLILIALLLTSLMFF